MTLLDRFAGSVRRLRANGARRHHRHLGLLRVDAGTWPALSTARDRREDGPRTQGDSGGVARGSVADRWPATSSAEGNNLRPDTCQRAPHRGARACGGYLARPVLFRRERRLSGPQRGRSHPQEQACFGGGLAAQLEHVDGLLCGRGPPMATRSRRRPPSCPGVPGTLSWQTHRRRQRVPCRPLAHPRGTSRRERISATSAHRLRSRIEEEPVPGLGPLPSRRPFPHVLPLARCPPARQAGHPSSLASKRLPSALEVALPEEAARPSPRSAADSGHADRLFRPMPITRSGQGDHPGRSAAG